MSNELIYFLLGVLFSIIFGYYFYRKGLRIKEPIYSIKSVNWISGSVYTLANLKVTYKDYRVGDLTVSKILFYNRGAETINRQDLVASNPLRISSESHLIYDGSVLQVNNISNNISVHYDNDGQNIFVDFDYLDKNQGAVIQVVHTGLSSADLSVRGDIKGVQKLMEVQSERFRRGLYFDNLSRSAKVMVVGFFFSGLIAMIMLVVAYRMYSTLVPNVNQGLDTPILFSLGIGTFVILLGIINVVQNIFGIGRRLPYGLEIFLQ